MHIGFIRRYDSGYAISTQPIAAGEIGGQDYLEFHNRVAISNGCTAIFRQVLDPCLPLEECLRSGDTVGVVVGRVGYSVSCPQRIGPIYRRNK